MSKRIVLALLLCSPMVLSGLEAYSGARLAPAPAAIVAMWDGVATAWAGQLDLREAGAVAGRIGNLALQNVHLVRDRGWARRAPRLALWRTKA